MVVDKVTLRNVAWKPRAVNQKDAVAAAGQEQRRGRARCAGADDSDVVVEMHW
jgi:hypothetical protein